ncbi:hypothetical protein M413DRAFT_72793, partial [Hebeloma cylindrosporum]
WSNFTTALLYYDYSLTWTREVKYFWTRKFTLSTALYILCRYPLVANVIYLLAISNKLPTLRVSNLDSLSRCIRVLTTFSHRIIPYSFSDLIITVIAYQAVWGARTYAVFNRNRWILAFFGSLGITILVFGAVSH